jgi:hypothetical protein
VVAPPKVPSSPDILSFSPLEIARQFTLIVSGQFKSLKIAEFHLLRYVNFDCLMDLSYGDFICVYYGM